MAYEQDHKDNSTLIGDLELSQQELGTERATQRVPALIEVNVLYPGGLGDVLEVFFNDVWKAGYHLWTGEALPPEDETPATYTQPRVPPGLRRVTSKLYQCVLTRPQLAAMVDRDREVAQQSGQPVTIFKVWPDYQLEAQIDRSAPTVKADAAWRSYNARGRGIVWAVVDSGIDGKHAHFSGLELFGEAHGRPPASTALAARLHKDFTDYVELTDPAPPTKGAGPLTDEQGHGTHVAGIIAGRTPDGRKADVAASQEPTAAGYVPRLRVECLSGMAPECQLVSLKVLRRQADNTWVTSSSAVIAALNYLRTEVNVDPSVLRVHGVNMSLGAPWDPKHYAAGQSPLSQAVNQLVDSGVVVVVSAGNSGADAESAVAALGSITEPAHADNCIAVGSTHREAPHAFGVTWTSSKGPTLDGRFKPDVVAPGEWITSAAAGLIRQRYRLPDPDPVDELAYLTYAEQSGTSMAAPHVSGVIAAFLSARPEFIGRPREIKRLLMQCATDLGRERYAQGAGLVDLMRMLANV